jgi:hypothetical protein
MRGADVLRGQRLVVDLTSGVSRMDQGRVEGLFQRTRKRNDILTFAPFAAASRSP